MPRINIPTPNVTPSLSGSPQGIPTLPGGAGQQTAAIASQLQESLEQVRQINNFRESSIATIGLKRELLNLRDQFDKDDPESFDKYNQAVDAAVEKAANSITDPLAAAEYAPQLLNHGFSAKNILYNMNEKKIREQAFGSFINETLETEELYKTSDPNTRQNLEIDFETRLDAAYKNGVINASMFVSLKQGFRSKWQKQAANEMIATASLDELDAIVEIGVESFAQFSDITEPEKLVLLQTASSAKKQRENIAKQQAFTQQFDTSMNYIKGMTEGEPEYYDKNRVEAMMLNNEMPLFIGEAILSFLENPDIVAEVEIENPEFAATMKNIFSTKSKEEVLKMVETGFNARRDKKITQSQFEVLLYTAMARGEDVITLFGFIEDEADFENKIKFQGGRKPKDVVTELKSSGELPASFIQVTDWIDDNADRLGVGENGVIMNFMRKVFGLGEDKMLPADAAEAAIVHEKMMRNPLYRRYRNSERIFYKGQSYKINGWDYNTGDPLLEVEVYAPVRKQMEMPGKKDVLVQRGLFNARNFNDRFD